MEGFPENDRLIYLLAVRLIGDNIMLVQLCCLSQTMLFWTIVAVI